MAPHQHDGSINRYVYVYNAMLSKLQGIECIFNQEIQKIKSIVFIKNVVCLFFSPPFLSPSPSPPKKSMVEKKWKLLLDASCTNDLKSDSISMQSGYD